MREISLRVRPAAAGFVFLLVVAGCAGAATSGAPAGAPGEALGPMPASSAVASVPAAPAEEGETAAFRDDALIVRTGTLELQVTDVDVAAASARTTIRELGGYVGASRRTNDGDHPVASITYRIPSARWDQALDAIRALGSKILGEQTEAEEVTSQVVDLGARIANLQASERSLQAIAERATKISEVLEIQRELTGVRGEIERLVAQKQSLEARASFGTLTVTYGVEVVAIAEAQRDWNPASEVDRASASLVDILQAVTSAGIWFAIVWLPMLLALAVFGLGASIVLRRMGLMRRPSGA